MTTSLNNTKDMKTRIEECKEVRVQLQKVGALIDNANAQTVAMHMNCFVKDGSSQGFTLKIDDNNNVTVSLSSTQNKKSGIVLERKRKLL